MMDHPKKGDDKDESIDEELEHPPSPWVHESTPLHDLGLRQPWRQYGTIVSRPSS